MPANNAGDVDKYRFPTVDFDSELVAYAFEVERLRGDFGRGSTPAELLADLHELLQLVMSVVSARIEGNRTTIYEAIDADPQDPDPDESAREIRNILTAMSFIDQTDRTQPITHVFVRELHRLSVDGLTREGDPTPGAYRAMDVGISASRHRPPSHVYVQSEMNDLLEFANREIPTSQQMIHVAMAHHRFLWVHPFRNGNGRVARLLSYAMLRRHGFESPFGFRTVNPAAVFGNDRDGYYAALAAADDLSNEGTIEWCSFFVRGIHDDMERLTRLQDFGFVSERLLAPALEGLASSGAATRAETQAMSIAVAEGVVKAGDLSSALPGSPSQRSGAIHEMLAKGLLVQDARGPRFYRVVVSRPPLAAFLIRQLDALGFLPRILRDDDRH